MRTGRFDRLRDGSHNWVTKGTKSKTSCSPTKPQPYRKLLLDEHQIKARREFSRLIKEYMTLEEENSDKVIINEQFIDQWYHKACHYAIPKNLADMTSGWAISCGRCMVYESFALDSGIQTLSIDGIRQLEREGGRRRVPAARYLATEAEVKADCRLVTDRNLPVTEVDKNIRSPFKSKQNVWLVII